MLLPAGAGNTPPRGTGRGHPAGRRSGTTRVGRSSWPPVAALGGFPFGFDTAVINGAVTAIRDDFGMRPALTGSSDYAIATAAGGAAEGPARGR